MYSRQYCFYLAKALKQVSDGENSNERLFRVFNTHGGKIVLTNSFGVSSLTSCNINSFVTSMCDIIRTSTDAIALLENGYEALIEGITHDSHRYITYSPEVIATIINSPEERDFLTLINNKNIMQIILLLDVFEKINKIQ